MAIETLTSLFAWMSVINLAIITVGFLEIVILKGPISSFHGALFNLEKRDIQKTFYQVLAYYKISILMFNIVPYLALRIIG